MRKYHWIALALPLALILAGCATTGTGVDNRRSSPSKYLDPDAETDMNTPNLESNDIRSCCDAVVGKMLANPLLANQPRPPHVIVDSQYFANQTSRRLDKDLLTDNLRTELIRAANGRIIFVGREYVDMVESERALKREGVVGPGTAGASPTTLGADYRLGGRITELVETVGGRTDRYTQITFEMLDLETAQIIFNDTCDVKKSQELGPLYR